MRDWVSNGATTVLVVCALVVTTLVVRRELRGRPDTAVEQATQPDWRDYTAYGHRIGPPDAPVMIAAFSDFECPACRLLAGRLQDLRARYPQQVAVVYRHFPLSQHIFARPAARASECAATQGRFEAMHDVLYQHQDSLGAISWVRLAKDAGVADDSAFVGCFRGHEIDAVLRRDSIAGRRLGIRATPTILINATRLVGVPSEARMEQLVRHALDTRGPHSG